MHCKYLPLSPYKPLEKFSKALYGTKGGTYSARIFRPVMLNVFFNLEPCHQPTVRFLLGNCRFLYFHSLIKSAFLVSKGLLCLYDKQNNT